MFVVLSETLSRVKREVYVCATSADVDTMVPVIQQLHSHLRWRKVKSKSKLQQYKGERKLGSGFWKVERLIQVFDTEN